MIVYLIHCIPEDMYYVGKTTKTLKERMRTHFDDYKRFLKGGKKSAPLLYQAVKRNGGWDNFEWHEVDFATTKEELSQKEREWIAKLGTQYNGYNIGAGGDGGDNYSMLVDLDKTKKKISESVRKSERWTDEKRKIESIRKKEWNKNNKGKVSEWLRERWKNPTYREKEILKMRGSKNPMKNDAVREKHLNICRSKEHRDKISKALKGRKRSVPRTEEHRRNLSLSRQRFLYAKFDKDTNELIGVYTSFDLGKQRYGIFDNRYFPTRLPYGFKWLKFRKDEITKEEIYKIYGKGL